MRLIDLIDKKPCSLRLKLSIRGASMRGELPANTVGEYLALGDSAPTEFQKLYDLGPKIARELDRTITTFMNRSLAKDRKTRVAANRDAAGNNAIDGASASTLRALEAALKKAPLPKVLFGKNISTSLHNMLQLNVLEANNLLDYARSRVLIRHRMRKMHVVPRLSQNLSVRVKA